MAPACSANSAQGFSGHPYTNVQAHSLAQSPLLHSTLTSATSPPEVAHGEPEHKEHQIQQLGECAKTPHQTPVVVRWLFPTGSALTLSTVLPPRCLVDSVPPCSNIFSSSYIPVYVSVFPPRTRAICKEQQCSKTMYSQLVSRE